MIENTNRGTGASRRRTLTRRDFLKLGGAGLAGASMLGAAGCGGGGGGSFNGELIFSNGRETSGALASLIKKFNQQHKGDITVKWRRAPSQSEQYFDELRTQFQAQSGDIHVMAGDVIWPAQFAANGYILDLTDRFTDDMASKFLQGPVESNTYEGKRYGVPWYTDAGLLYYRKDLLQKYNLEPPKTWEELQDQANQIKQDEGLKFGFVFQGANYEGGVCNGLEYINSHGGSVLDPNDATKVVIDSPEAVAGLETYRGMVESGASPQAVSTYDEPTTEAPFLQNGDAAFARNWPYMYSLAGSEDFAVKKNQIDIVPLPAGPGGESTATLGGWNFFINAFADTEAQDAAWEFVKFMTSEQSQKEWATVGTYLPALSSLYEDPEVAEQVPTVRLAPTALKQTAPRPVSPVYSDMSLELGEQFNAVLNGDVSPQEGANTLQKQLQGIADQAAG